MRYPEKFKYSYGIRGIPPFSIRSRIRQLERDLLRQERHDLGVVLAQVPQRTRGTLAWMEAWN